MPLKCLFYKLSFSVNKFRTCLQFGNSRHKTDIFTNRIVQSEDLRFDFDSLNF